MYVPALLAPISLADEKLEVSLASLPDDDPQLTDDPNHPIPYGFNCDVNVVKKSAAPTLWLSLHCLLRTMNTHSID